MTSYVITDIKVTDQERYKAHMAMSPAAVEAYGGEFLARGGRHEVLEGSWEPHRLVIIKFPSFEKAKAFYDSALYLEARDARVGATGYFNMVVVQGADEQ